MHVTRDDIVASIREAKVIENPESLRADIKLTDQGIDSLGMFNIILVLQEKHGIDIPDPDIDRLHTIDELTTYINGRLS